MTGKHQAKAFVAHHPNLHNTMVLAQGVEP
jgi:hypothetical protein